MIHVHWQDVAQDIVKCHLRLVEVLPRFKFWKKKWNWSYLLNLLLYFDNILQTHYYWHDLDRGIAKSSPTHCKMTVNVDRGYAELQILKKWKWLNWVRYGDEILHTRWYWQDVALEIVKCHLVLAEALPMFKFWKTVKLYLLKRFEYFDQILHTHYYWCELDRGIAKCHLSSVEAMPRFKSLKQVKLTLSLEPFGTFCYVAVEILEKVRLKLTLHIFICKKVQIQDIIFLCVT